MLANAKSGEAGNTVISRWRSGCAGMRATIGEPRDLARGFSVSLADFRARPLGRPRRCGPTPTLRLGICMRVEPMCGMSFSADVAHSRFTPSGSDQ